MHIFEEKIIEQISKNSILVDYKPLESISLGRLSEEFYKNKSVVEYSQRDCSEPLLFRLLLEKYLALTDSEASLKTELLKDLEKVISKLPSPKGHDDLLQNKAAGTYLLPVSIELLCQVYVLDDKPLIELFQRHFPTPPMRLFDNKQLPEFIRQRDLEAKNTIKDLLKTTSFEKLESITIKIQRLFRMRRRRFEELNRIALRDTSTCMNPKLAAEALLQDANTPYRPKCSDKLADRIMAAASKVAESKAAPFSTVKHITSAFLPHILDDALYGRRNLLDLYLKFNPATLDIGDILNGDGNVICCGPQSIDPKANGKIIIEFDLLKLIQTKPAAFFKQRDLEYKPSNPLREVKLGSETFRFDHTGYNGVGRKITQTYLQILNPETDALEELGQAEKSRFISYNLERMHEILTLNFFRFIDNIRENSNFKWAGKFYFKLRKLSDEQLEAFLAELESKMTDTAEFNFYGAYQVDFSTVKSFTLRNAGPSLILTDFITALRQGNIEELNRARSQIPELFQSYRFLNFLIAQITPQDTQLLDVIASLHDLRRQCKTPIWAPNPTLLSVGECKSDEAVRSTKEKVNQLGVISSHLDCSEDGVPLKKPKNHPSLSDKINCKFFSPPDKAALMYSSLGEIEARELRNFFNPQAPLLP